MNRVLLGQVMVQRGVINAAALARVLERQQASGKRLASQCLQEQLATEEALLACLSDQLGVPGISLGDLVLPLALLELVPEAVARRQLILPLQANEGRLYLAMTEPGNRELASELSFFSNRQVVIYVALQGALQAAIDAAYEARREGHAEYRGPAAGDKEISPIPSRLIYPPEVTLVPGHLLARDQDLGREPGRELTGGLSSSRLAALTSQEFVIEIDDGLEGDLLIPDAEVDLFARFDAGVSEAGAPADSATAAVPSSSLARMDVLIVDDDPDLRRLVVRVLEKRGIAVRQASRGLEGLSQIRKQLPDLVLLDAMLPEIHGFDICRKLKSSERYSNIPIIMISSVYRGWRIAHDLKESYGVEAFLEKPLSIELLWKTVEQVVASRVRGKSQQPCSSRSVARIYGEAVQYYRQGRIDAAVESCQLGLQEDPFSPRLHHLLGVLYLKKKGLIFQAMYELEEAATLDPSLFAAQRVLAILYQRRGFKNKAIEMWEQAMRSAPGPKIAEKIRTHLKSLL